MNAFDRVEQCVSQIREKIQIVPRVGVVLGSGLGALADQAEQAVSIPYSEIEGFPVSTAPGHVGRYVVGQLEGIPVILMQGRIHLYEGYDVETSVLPVRVMIRLGIQALVLTNAAGAIREDIEIGDFCLLRDHISSFVPSPLRGANEDRWGVRFPDMSEVYNAPLREQMRLAGEQSACRMHEGVYVQLQGPAYETPAEIRMLRALGADLVGMSTVIEAQAAHHMGVPLVAVSLASNKAAGLGSALSEDDVIRTGERSAEKFQRMIREFLRSLAKSRKKYEKETK